jgi:pyruvate/2-oxoglutarate dehydrogenase complex dihydrolipoamide acyltransferase (E2) component
MGPPAGDGYRHCKDGGVLMVRRIVVMMIAAAAAASGTSYAQQAPAPAAPAARVFASDAGLVLNFVKADKTADFEMIVAKLREALAKSDKPERRQQAASWKVFKALEPAANGNALYVFVIDPAVKGADYTVSTVLAEAFPDQVQDLYKRYADAYASGQNFVNLTLMSALGAGAAQASR